MNETTLILTALGLVLSVLLIHLKSNREKLAFEQRIMTQHHKTQMQLQKVRLAVSLIANQLGIQLPNGDSDDR